MVSKLFLIITIVSGLVNVYAQPIYLSDFQYFTDSQSHGGGPFPGGNTFRYNNSSARDTLLGIVHTNDDLILPNYQQIEFYGPVSASGSITNTHSDHIFHQTVEAHADSFRFPTEETLNMVKAMADYTFIADTMLNRPGKQDTLIMTDLTFTPEGLLVEQWCYQIPPIQDDSPHADIYSSYHTHSIWEPDQKCGINSFHHFDFDPPPYSAALILDQFINTDSALIYIRGGQVRIRGEVSGQFSIITDEKTEYLRGDSSGLSDFCYNNIWLMSDVIYADSNPETGEVQPQTPNRLGLVSGANVIIANTPENGAWNQNSGESILVNAAIVTLSGSFISHYWQNSTTDYWHSHFGKGDDRGRIVESSIGDSIGNVTYITTGPADIRGSSILFGSLAVSKQISMRRNFVGPYNISPGIGYTSKLNYDTNLFNSPPPGFEYLVNPLNTTPIEPVSEILPEQSMYQNYPNPFNPTTMIEYEVKEQALVSLIIYDMGGRKVRTLVLKSQPLGKYQTVWNGRNENGRFVSGGIYIAKLQTGEHISTIKMVLVK